MEEDIPSPPPPDDSTPKLAANKSATSPDEEFTLVQTRPRRANYKTDSKDLSKCRVRFCFLLPPQDEASADITKEIKAEGLKLSAYTYLRHIVQALLTMHRSHDPKITILPWTKASPGQPIGKARWIRTLKTMVSSSHLHLLLASSLINR
jgi:hypothetical protein